MHIIQFFVTQLVVKPDPTAQLVWRMPDGREFDLRAGHIQVTCRDLVIR